MLEVVEGTWGFISFNSGEDEGLADVVELLAGHLQQGLLLLLPLLLPFSPFPFSVCWACGMRGIERELAGGVYV